MTDIRSAKDNFHGLVQIQGHFCNAANVQMDDFDG